MTSAMFVGLGRSQGTWNISNWKFKEANNTGLLVDC